MKLDLDAIEAYAREVRVSLDAANRATYDILALVARVRELEQRSELRSRPITGEAFTALRAEVERRYAARREHPEPVSPAPPPRYDDVYFEGIAQLEGLARDEEDDG